MFLTVAGLMVVLGLSAPARSLYALPLLVPLAIPGAPAAKDLSARLDQNFPLMRALPARYDCIASTEPGAPQRALLEYFIDVRTIRCEVDPAPKRKPLLKQTDGKSAIAVRPSEWTLVRQGARLRHPKEHYGLYERMRDGNERRLWDRAGKFEPPSCNCRNEEQPLNGIFLAKE